MDLHSPHLPHFHFTNVFRSKFLFLLISCVLVIFVAPYFVGHALGVFFLGLTTSLILIAVVFTMAAQRHKFIIGCLLAVLTVTFNVVRLYFGGVGWTIAYESASLMLYSFAIFVIAVEILRGKVITPNTLFGALSVYLLIGLLYGNAYHILSLISPGAFVYPESPNPLIDLFNLTYFSFTTLTTVGFGDIIPVSLHAKSIVILEGITGVLYLAALVSRLVSGMVVAK